jgi:CRP-like cAMP-binding protein
MNPPSFSTFDPGRGLERAPLTRLRVSTRPVPGLGSDGRAHLRGALPDAAIWAVLLGVESVSAPELEALNEVARVRAMEPGSVVFRQADLPRGVLLVGAGDVALGVRAEEGGFRTERHIHGPGWLDTSCGLLGEAYICDARVLTPAMVVDIAREALLAVMARFPKVAQGMLLAVAGEARLLALNTYDLMHRDAPARLAAWLDARCLTADSAACGVVQLPMRKRDIASQLAITPETLSRLMRTFSSQGLIQVEGYTVHVLDREALRRLARS